MAQKRIHDYRGPRSSENLNRHLVSLIPPGVYAGFRVDVGGWISPGVLLTAEGVRLEETETVELPSIPMGDALHPRLDLVVCRHEYLATVPAEEAVFEVIPGTPAEDPEPPDLPEHCVLLATCRMEPGADEWAEVSQACPPARVVNAQQQSDRTWQVINGALGALREEYDPNTGTWKVFLVTPGQYGDGEVLDWGQPVLTATADGVTEILTLQSGKLDKAGGTIAGDLVLQGKVTFDADDAADIAFDDWVPFERSLAPASAHSAPVGGTPPWVYLPDYDAWECQDAGAQYCYLVAPLEGIKDAELVSVKVLLENPTGSPIGNIWALLVRSFKNGNSWDNETLLSSNDNSVATGVAAQLDLTLATPKSMAAGDLFTAKILAKTQGLRFRGVAVVFRRKRVVA
jgi:hypothetical protein